MEPVTFVKLAHLLGLIMGLGGALLSDYIVATQAVLRPVTHGAIRQIHSLSQFVALGLGLLWISGTGLAIFGIAMDARFVENPKFWCKVAIVTVLTLNSLLIHFFALPRMQRSLGRRLMFDGPRKEATQLAFIGSLSFVSWMTAFILGTAKEFNFRTPAWEIAAAYVLTVLLVWFLWIAAISGHHSWRDAKRRRAIARRSTA